MCSTGREEVEKKLEQWRRAMEDRGLKISRKKAVYMKSSVDENLDGNSDINLQGDLVKGDCIYIPRFDVVKGCTFVCRDNP